MDDQTREELLGLFKSKFTRAMRYYLETCTRCGVCTEACHVYASTGQLHHIAVYRHEIVRRLYKRYFKARGNFWPSLGESKELTDMTLEELYGAAYSCTGCRRCMVFCPFGIDTQMLMSIAKLLLIGASAEPEILSLLADTSIEKGKSLELFKESFMTGIHRLEEEVVKAWQVEAGETAIPIDVEGADLLYVALAGAHSIIPAAAVFNAAGENWTLSFFEAVNFGAFVGDPSRTKLILDRIVNEAKRLKVKEVCICECGTAFRVMKQLSGKQPFEVSTITDVHARYLREGRIRLDKTTFEGRVTYHDPCQIARNGGVFDAPRYILGHLTDDFNEMIDDPRYNWCCGGGGGLVAMGEDTLAFRMQSARVKAEQVEKTGAKILSTACENCHTQLSDLNDHYKMGVDVRFLSSMVADALVPN
ncbi:Sulfite reduction-associated complex DsrMKJOP protein DsrK (=HmeD) [Olavius algarvensis associated proteobacterium Delta 3]|nr:Sulfite reduction-associated complex DsrMKJOP protein DsrK (=HmeD) [Olavius algarvensis associated proteobacterium Delta 3]CAB5155200.1 Sulfite reduction-associated complex DsrMKJOP protein DsrK (=HmeD) [Olavius algarvensis associated proteobacterium Delta 3]